MSDIALKPHLLISVWIIEQFCGIWVEKEGAPSARIIVSWMIIDSSWIVPSPDKAILWQLTILHV